MQKALGGYITKLRLRVTYFFPVCTSVAILEKYDVYALAAYQWKEMFG